MISPWEAEQFSKFLKDKQNYIKQHFADNTAKEMIDLVFKILQQGLKNETEDWGVNFEKVIIREDKNGNSGNH